MLRRAFSLCAVLGLASSAYAGAVISLVPSAPANGVGYLPGEVVNVGVFAQLSAGTPSIPNQSGATTVRVRMLQFDVSDSSPALVLTPVGHHPDSEPVGGPIPFWDLSGGTACAADSTSCGNNYFIDGSFTDATPKLLNITYTGLTTSASAMVTLNQAAAKRVGELNVTLPNTAGSFVLDVLNADETDINLGAELRWGFGSTNDPTDPTSPLRANSTTAAAGIVMIPGQENGLSLTVVPEPATLALLGMGGLAAAFRRRRNA